MSAPATSTPGAAAAAAPRAAGRRRELTVGALAVVGGGIITLGLMSVRGASTSDAAGAASGAAQSQAAAVASAQPAVTTTQTWSIENRAFWVGNRPKSPAFELPAENTVQVWLRQVRPALVVRCMSQRPEVFVVTESAMKIERDTDNHTVTFSFDNEPSVTEQWPDSAEHDALFAPDGDAFAQRLVQARAFRFGYTPHNVDPVIAHFNVSGLAPLIEPVAKECGWKK
jgi:hypothetical protein